MTARENNIFHSISPHRPAREVDSNISAIDILKLSRRLSKGHGTTLAIVYLASIIIGQLFSYIGLQAFPESSSIPGMIYSGAVWFLVMVLAASSWSYFYHFVNGDKKPISYLISHYNMTDLIDMICVWAIYAMVLVACFFLFVIPGIIVSFAYKDILIISTNEKYRTIPAIDKVRYVLHGLFTNFGLYVSVSGVIVLLPMVLNVAVLIISTHISVAAIIATLCANVLFYCWYSPILGASAGVMHDLIFSPESELHERLMNKYKDKQDGL